VFGLVGPAHRISVGAEKFPPSPPFKALAALSAYFQAIQRPFFAPQSGLDQRILDGGEKSPRLCRITYYYLGVKESF
jgi:hypothetical protein